MSATELRTLITELRTLIQNFYTNYPKICHQLSNNTFPLTVDNFFQRVNQMDSVKDGADRSSASYFFTNNEFTGILHNFKSVVCHYTNGRYEGLFEDMIINGTMKLIPYSRIKGDKHNKEVICDSSIYDCGISPETLAKDRNNNDPTPITTYGNMFDTGPSSSNKANFPVGGHIIEEDILTLLGYKESRIIFDAKSKCTELKLYGNKYQNPETSLTKFKQGNAKKKILLTKNPTTADKASLLYVKSLGDKLIAWFYYLYCKKNPSLTSCIFTCDMFVALYALIFDKNFVFNVNDQKEPKVTRVYYKGAAINWDTLFTDKYDEIIEDYNSNIYHLNTIIQSTSKVYFTGTGEQEYRKGFIDYLIQQLKSLYEDHLLPLFQENITTDNRRANYSDLLSYKLFNFLNVSTSQKKNKYEFVRSRFKLCIKDTPFKNKQGKKLNLYELYKSFQQTRGGARKIWSLFKEFPNEDLSNDYPHYHNVPSGPVYIYDISKLKDSDSDIKESLYKTVTEVYTRLYDKLTSQHQQDCNKFFRSNTMSSFSLLRNKKFEDNYSYNDIYDTLTYYFYADPKYDVYSIFNVIYDLFVELDIHIDHNGYSMKDFFNKLFSEYTKPITPSRPPDNISCLDTLWCNPFSSTPQLEPQSEEYSQVSTIDPDTNSVTNLFGSDTVPLFKRINGKKINGGKKRIRTNKKIKSKRRNTRKNKKYYCV